MVNIAFESLFRVAYENWPHFSVFVIEVATLFENPVKLFILSASATLFKFCITHPGQFNDISTSSDLFHPPTQTAEPHYFNQLQVFN